MTGHDNGVITLDLAEGDDVHREQLRVEMDEPYRTLLGHFRHEIGHYYYYRLIAPSTDYVARFNELFGDPDADYQEALDRHYSEGAPEGWKKNFVSSYATMHAAEDWAETFAHYLHIRDTLDTSAWCGLAPATATFDRPALGPSAFPNIIDMWLPLSWSLNMVNRSMGHDDLYPFVLPAAVLEKMQFIHTVIDEVTAPQRQARPGCRLGPARGHGITRRSSGPHSGCMPPGSASCVAVMTSASSRNAACTAVSRSANCSRRPSADTCSSSAGCDRRSRVLISATIRSGRDDPDEPGRSPRSARSRSSWYTSDRGFVASNSISSARAATLTLPTVRRR